VSALRLVRPASEHLPQYIAALEAGWSASNINSVASAAEEMEKIKADPTLFLAQLDDPAGLGGPIALGDGRVVPRLPGFRRWMWDGELCGSIGFRHQPGTSELPDYVLGHIGYGVVPWKRGQGMATRALGLLLAEIAPLRMAHVDLTTDPENHVSQKVIQAHGGVLIDKFEAVGYGKTELRWRIKLGGW
jgi:predicted acetyltransferase